MTRPNLLLIMSDQHRHDWYGMAGASWTRTPNLDRLAGSGLRFTQATCNSPLCAPARISLATGLQPHRIGAMSNQAVLPLSTPTYYQALRESGYRVACVGKIDLHKPNPFNGRDGNLPITYAYGFTDPVECEGKMHAGQGWDWATGSPKPNGPYDHYLLKRGKLETFCADYRHRLRDLPVWYAADSVLAAEDCEDAYIGRRAREFIERVSDESPWHLFVSFVGPHDPWDPPTSYAEHFRDTAVPAPVADTLEDKPQWQHRKATSQAGATAEEISVVRRQYSAWLELIDDQIGAILAALRQRGLAGNTYVLYCSDHGEMLGDHGLYQKSVAYDSALRVPLVAAGPRIAPGVSDALVELSDIHPTLLDLAEVEVRPGLDAQSFAPLLRGVATTHRSDAVAELSSFRLLRTRRYKYVENVNDLPELYDLQADPSEMHNLAASNSETLAELRHRLSRRLR